MMQVLDMFCLRDSRETLRLAIEASYFGHEKKLPSNLANITKKLGKRMGVILHEKGYKDFSAERLVSEENDYRTRVGIGVFLEAEKYNDMRGFLLACLEETETALATKGALLQKLTRITDWIESNPALSAAWEDYNKPEEEEEEDEL
ncbi:MAG: hypothetical protein GY861_27025 [bacterium]|nr:hypothetical protein [bacterium]